MIRTRFTEMFGIELPLMAAPMALHSGATLAAAVSAAGGLGAFGGISASGATWVTEQARLTREATDAPFAIGFITAFVPAFEGHLDAALAASPAAVALSFGDPAPWAGRVRDAGARLICQVQTLPDADRAVDCGADVLVAQGNEAGGHTGTMGLLPLLTAVVERHHDVPVLAAGGIGSGRALAAALVAGADGAWLGTALLATPEAVEVSDAHKAAIVDSDGGDTVFTHAYDIASQQPWPEGIGDRMRRDAFTDEWDGREHELRAAPDRAEPGTPLRYGQSAGAVAAIEPVADVLARLVSDAERLLQDRPATLLAAGRTTR